MRVTRFDRFLSRNYELVMCALMVTLGYLATILSFFAIDFIGGFLWG